MTSIRRLTAAGAALAMLTSAVLGAGCGEAGDTDPTPVQTFKITPAANATDARTPVPATTPASEPTSPATSVAGGAIALASINSQFDLEQLAAPAGTVTIEFDNRDGGTVHNLHVFKGGDSDGESVGETELEAGPVTQTLTMDLEPGAYFYVCDAHPNTMSGTLTVN
jgi:plastocyanin